MYKILVVLMLTTSACALPTGPTTCLDAKTEWDRLNREQAKLYVAAGEQVDAQQQRIIDRMEQLENANPTCGINK